MAYQVSFASMPEGVEHENLHSDFSCPRVSFASMPEGVEHSFGGVTPQVEFYGSRSPRCRKALSTKRGPSSNRSPWHRLVRLDAGRR